MSLCEHVFAVDMSSASLAFKWLSTRKRDRAVLGSASHAFALEDTNSRT